MIYFFNFTQTENDFFVTRTLCSLYTAFPPASAHNGATQQPMGILGFNTTPWNLFLTKTSTYPNTLYLETCLGWKGRLIETNTAARFVDSIGTRTIFLYIVLAEMYSRINAQDLKLVLFWFSSLMPLLAQISFPALQGQLVDAGGYKGILLLLLFLN